MPPQRGQPGPWVIDSPTSAASPPLNLAELPLLLFPALPVQCEEEEDLDLGFTLH